MVAFSVYKFIPMSEGLAEILFDKRGSTERKSNSPPVYFLESGVG